MQNAYAKTKFWFQSAISLTKLQGLVLKSKKSEILFNFLKQNKGYKLLLLLTITKYDFFEYIIKFLTI